MRTPARRSTTLPKVVMNLLLSFLWEISEDELFGDLEYFIRWHKFVPPLFLSPTLMDTRFFYPVASPMRPNYPYTPRRFLHMDPCDIWAQTLPALVNMLCSERVREIKSYKGCIQRWTLECVTSRHLEFYLLLCKKALIKLNESHFRRAFPIFFVREALRQTRALYDSSVRV